jgi:SOS-response transcriptional repressor LexA
MLLGHGGKIQVAYKPVKKKTGDLFPPGSVPATIKALRKRLQIDQTVMAEHLGVTQATVSGWENGEYPPSPMALMALGRMDFNNAAWWFEQAGSRFLERYRMGEAYRKVQEDRRASSDESTVWVPLMHDAVAAGLGRAIADHEIDRLIPFVRDLMPRGGKLRALRVAGESMAPIIQTGYIVVVDAQQQDAKRLVGKMVAAREGDDVTIKWLRKDGDLYLLIPQHTSPAYPVRIMRPDGDFSVIGEVVKWVGYPPPVRK